MYLSDHALSQVILNFWWCQYPAAVNTDPDNPNIVLTGETSCDATDEDCNGNLYNGFPTVGDLCADAGVGVCRGTGAMQCNMDGTGTECVIDTPGLPSSVEICDTFDNDCDGVVDELDPADPDRNQWGDFVYVNSGGTDVTIFAYEASRPTATAADAGVSDVGLPCSNAGVLPWSGVTSFDATGPVDATAAELCQRLGLGWDICDATDWQTACEGPGVEEFPYGSGYQSLSCNGWDYGDTVHGFIAPVPTGEAVLCERDWSGSSIFDMSGNLKEWVWCPTCDGGVGAYILMGGAYNNVSSGGEAPGLQCGAVAPLNPGTEIHLPSIGFRCCYSGDFLAP